MTINIDPNVTNKTFEIKEYNLFKAWKNEKITLEQLIETSDRFGYSIGGIAQQAEQAGIALDMLENKDADGKIINATWTDKTYEDLENVNLKYKDNAAAAKLYKRSLDSLAKAKALDTRSSQANLNVTKTSAMADKIKSASLYAKSGAYKIAAAAVNLFNSAIIKEIALTAAISIGVMAVFSALTKLWEAVPTQNHLKEWAEESATALQETRDEIDSTKSELETIGERIDELQSKGSLSFTEQEELERLQKENLELEKRLAI